MGSLTETLLMGIGTSLVASVLYTEGAARIPGLSGFILERAVNRLPRHLRPRYLEEWHSFLHGQPSNLSGLIAAVGMRVIAERVRAPGAVMWIRLFDRTFAAGMILLLAPILAIIATLILVLDGRPVSTRTIFFGEDGETRTIRHFRKKPRDLPTDAASYRSKRRRFRFMLRLGHFLDLTALDYLPELFAIVRGQLALVGSRPMHPAVFQDLQLQAPLLRPGVTGLRFLHRATNPVVSSADAYYDQYIANRFGVEQLYHKELERSALGAIRMWARCLRLSFKLAIFGRY